MVLSQDLLLPLAPSRALTDERVKIILLPLDRSKHAYFYKTPNASRLVSG